MAQVDQQFGSTSIALQSLSRLHFNDRLKLRHLSSLAVNLALNLFRQAMANDAAHWHVGLHLLSAPFGIARLTLLELAVPRRLAVADLGRTVPARPFAADHLIQT